MTDIRDLIQDAHRIVDEALAVHLGDRELVGTVILFSGGNDSTILAHLFRERATHAAHINTGIGVEQTRQFVRDVCSSWGLPLLERHPPAGSTYRELVLEHGFPGPAHHYKMYQRLKERGLDQIRRELVETGWKQRVLFLAGRRRQESVRRAAVPEHERNRSIIWASPLANWSALDMNAYRRLHPDVPENEVSANLHMSGECLCGSFAKLGEREELRFWYPEVMAGIEQLEEEVRAAGQPHCIWGWGATRDRRMIDADQLELDLGQLCSSCEYRASLEDSPTPAT